MSLYFKRERYWYFTLAVPVLSTVTWCVWFGAPYVLFFIVLFSFSTYSLDVVIVERSNYDPFRELEEEELGEGGPRTAARRQREADGGDSPYRLAWSVIRSILEILVDVVI